MQFVKAYYEGRVCVPASPVHEKNKEAVIAIVDDTQKHSGQPWRKFFGVLSARQC